MRTLVVGCDASGKSTLVGAIKDRYGDSVFESTSTDESRGFKHRSLDRQVDSEFIDERERLYMKLSRGVLDILILEDEQNYTGTDSTLVTRLSHNVMRRCIGGDPVDYRSIVSEWIKDEAEYELSPPDLVVVAHAPFNLILSRIQQRLNRGDKDEKFWGFNSPFFLNAYQDAWMKAKEHIEAAGVRCLSIDSSKVSPEEFLVQYGQVRDNQNQQDELAPV